jgi:hypothetical protein
MYNTATQTSELQNSIRARFNQVPPVNQEQKFDQFLETIETEFEDLPKETTNQEPQIKKEVPQIKKETIKHVNQAGPNAEEILKMIGQFVTPQQPAPAQIDKNEIIEIIKNELSKIESKTIEVKTPTQTNKIEGLIHYQFEPLLQAINQGLNVWLTGLPGIGKTKTAEQIAEALNLPFYCLSICNQSTKTDLLGYNDATGKYISTVFYEAFVNGGLFLLDEADQGNANTLNVLNAALANEMCSFPCGMVKKHKNFVCIAAANTTGTGGNIQNIGANRLNAATMDRFIMYNFEIDQQLELKIAPVEKFTKEIQKLRATANKKGLNVVISPRASINGGKLLLAGFDTLEALNMVLFNKLSPAEVAALKND